MSCRRSRSGGRSMRTTESRWNRSSRNVPVRTQAARSALVAVMRRKSERIIGDLVEEERRAVGELEDADPGPIRPRERAALVAEELALEERRRHRVAVLGD